MPEQRQSAQREWNRKEAKVDAETGIPEGSPEDRTVDGGATGQSGQPSTRGRLRLCQEQASVAAIEEQHGEEFRGDKRAQQQSECWPIDALAQSSDQHNC